MALNQHYHHLWFVSFILTNTSGHRSAIQLKLRARQPLPAEIVTECEGRHTDPFSLLTECSADYFTKHPVGTEFLIKAKLTDRKGGAMFFYTYYSWGAIQIVKARKRIKTGVDL